MNISGKISSAQFRDIVLASWRLGRMERDLGAADLVREIKRRLLAELQANAETAASADGKPAAGKPEAVQTAVKAIGEPKAVKTAARTVAISEAALAGGPAAAPERGGSPAAQTIGGAAVVGGAPSPAAESREPAATSSATACGEPVSRMADQPAGQREFGQAAGRRTE